MNIFCSSPDPFESAKFLDNKRVVKMVLETCQLLSTAINVTGGIGPYRTTHLNHPCSIWVRENRSNYDWTVQHFIALLEEYTLRYGKTHKCQQYLEMFQARRIVFKPGSLTQHPNCTTFKQIENGLNDYGYNRKFIF